MESPSIYRSIGGWLVPGLHFGRCCPGRGAVRLAWALLLAALWFFLPGAGSAFAGEQDLGQSCDDLFSVSFVDEMRGWACGRWGVVLHTVDGGKTWAQQSTGIDSTLSSIQFIDPRRGWAVGDQGAILHTRDGGNTWTRQKSPVPYFLMDLHFADALTGWIVTEKTTILHTGDGGNTWRVQFQDEDYILKAVSFCDSVNGWAVGEYGYIYRTRDGGNKWVKQAGSFGISESTGEIEGGTYLFAVAAVDPLTAWAVGIDSHIIRTTDGGLSWQKFPQSGSGTQLFCLYADAEGQVLTGGNGNFLYSGDRGATWQRPRFKPPLTYGWVYGLAKKGSGGFAAVGGDGVIYNSASGGWQRVRPLQAGKSPAGRR